MSGLCLSVPPAVMPNQAHPTAFKVVHQRLCIDVGVEEQTLEGVADLIVLPLTDQPLKFISINCRHEILSASIDGIPCSYEFIRPRTASYAAPRTAASDWAPVPAAGAPLGLEHVRDLASLDYALMEQADVIEHGHLKIAVPESKQRASVLSASAPLAAAAASATEGGEGDADTNMEGESLSGEIVREPLLLRIHYRFPRPLPGQRPRAGLNFLSRTPFAPNRAAQVCTSTGLSSGNEPSLWMPCADSWEERMTWALEITAPAGMTVLASGVLSSRTALPSAAKVRWEFRLDTPVLARSVGFAIAPLISDSLEAPSDSAAASASASGAGGEVKEPAISWHSVAARPAGLNKLDDYSSTSAASAPSQGPHRSAAPAPHASTLAILRHTVRSVLPGMFALYEGLFGSPYPFDSFKLVFLEEPYGSGGNSALSGMGGVPCAPVSSHLSFAGLLVLPRELLHSPTAIEAVYSSTHALAHAVASNWVQHALHLPSVSDWWIAGGLAGYAAGAFLSTRFGANHAKLSALLMAQEVLAVDAEMAPWCARVRAEDAASSSEDPLMHHSPPERRMYDSRPLYWPGSVSFSEVENPVSRAKAALVFQMLAQKLGGGSGSGAGGAGAAARAGSSAASGSGVAGAGGAPASAAAGGGGAMANLICRIMDEHTFSSDASAFGAGDDAGSGEGPSSSPPPPSSASPRPLSTLRLLELCIELSASRSGVASLSSLRSSAAASASTGSSTTLELLSSEVGQELRLFFEQWVWVDGYPSFHCGFEFKPKSKVTSLRVSQRPYVSLPSGSAEEGDPAGPANPNLLRFSGPLKCRIVEVDRINDQERLIPASMGAGLLASSGSSGALLPSGDSGAGGPGAGAASGGPGSGMPFSVVEPGYAIEFEFSCSSKVRRNRKRKKLDASVLATLPIRQVLIRHNDTPVQYARVDPLASWFGLLETRQESIHSLWKLLHEKDMLGQMDGVRQVAAAWRAHVPAQSLAAGADAAAAAKEAASGVSEEKMPDDIYPKALVLTLQSPTIYWPVRVLAARALGESASASAASAAASGSLSGGDNVKYVQFLMDAFKAQYVDGWDPALHASSAFQSASAAAAAAQAQAQDEGAATEAAEALQLRANDFTSIADYMLKQHIPLILSAVRVGGGKVPVAASSANPDAAQAPATRVVPAHTPGSVVRFLVWLLRDNDNAANSYSDVVYLSALLTALGNLRLSEHDSIAPVHAELIRYLHYDAVVPSYRHGLTCAALVALAKLERTRQIGAEGPGGGEFPAPDYASYCGPSFDRDVRLAAFKALVIVLPLRVHATLPRVMEVVEAETMPGASYKMLLQWAQQVVRGVCPARLFRYASNESAQFMNRLWNYINAAQDARTRDAAYRLYRCIWGRGTPACASESQRAASAQLHALFQANRAAADQLTHRRVAKAKSYLREARRPREFPSSGVRSHATGGGAGGRINLKVKRRAGGVLIAEAAVDDDAQDTVDFA